MAYTNPFSYQHFEYPKEQIRLLILHPAARPEDQIRCDLQHVHLTSNLEYEALSYTWGDKSNECSILIENRTFPVRKNLAAALRHLRDRDTTRTLWIDALCIDQDNDDEKNEQVLRMIDIYRHARRTLVWLGEWPEDPDHPEATPSSVQNFLHRAIELSRTDEMSYEDIIIHGDGLSCYLRTAELLESAWFKRIWVLQEAAVAQEVTFVCGETTFAWDVLIEGFLAIGNMKDPPYIISRMNRWFEIHLKAIIFCRRYVQDPEYRQDLSHAPLPDRLLSLLLLSNDQAATNQSDQLYALLGLAGQAEEMKQEKSLKVNYKKESGEVLTGLAIFLLKKTQDLSMLYGAAFQEDLDVPTWVPTWRGSRGWNLARYFDPRNPLIRLPDDTPTKIFLSCDEKSIMIKGHIVGHVTNVGRPARDEANDVQSIRGLFEDWEENILQPLAEDLPAACMRALVGDAFDPATDVDYGITAIGVWCQTLFHEKGWEEKGDDNENNIESLLYSTLMGHVQVDEATSERLNGMVKIFSSMEKQRFGGGAPFATSSGLVGFFENAVLLERYPNATICLFQGCRVPFILDGGPEEYILLGPCYLQPFITLETTFGYPDWITLV